MTGRRAIALRHVHFQDLGVYAGVLAAAGYEVDVQDVAAAGALQFRALDPDLLLVLGGPVGVYDQDAYPFLVEQQALLSERIAADRPTFGVCLGAQQMAAAMGARVAPMGHKEIGFAPLDLSVAGAAGPLRHLAGTSVLHWHGDMFEIPQGAQRLAATSRCANQAFARGPRILGLQFHAEVDVSRDLERWLVGHAVELATSGIDVVGLRSAAVGRAVAMAAAAREMFGAWLDGLRA
ncbi:glutamine amidotransferase [Phenylobacterium sp. SCN 70-31]|uniref:glutamine amidotransferase n=1 Tax=Phenylobacterium sp. SCN 70-31 TaxID=1660129 RepID=UPI00086EDE66|nr:glutamine amidotransferase [Phenylobacterium sp. SCN 70-31]ODT88362.1 MAG: glutamine amidotransferase [Phenylobacterium sp. SCN 70-31]